MCFTLISSSVNNPNNHFGKLHTGAMMNSLMLNINGIELKKLTPAMDTSGSVEKKFRRLNGRSSSNHSNADVLTTTISAFNSDKDKESSRHEVIETQFVPIGSQFTTVHTSPSIVMQHQSLQQHPQQPTSSETVPPILSDIEVLSAENQKLSSIARLCIHLVDRCRTLNKSKQFSEDLTKLGSLIDDFNRCNTRRGSSLPTFNNSGLVFQNPVVQANNNNLIYIPIQSTSDHSQQMVQQFLASGEKGNIRGGKGSKVRKQSNQFSEQHQQIEQSILFKKLTDSGQLLTTEIGKVDATSGGNTFTIPLSINDQNALFSIVNQIDNSNIENTPAKCKCLCHSVKSLIFFL